MLLLRKSRMIGIAVVSFTVFWFALLAQRPLFDPDEGRYAEIPREMLSGGDWVIPHLNGLIYLEKPPLQYWLTALAFRALGPSEFAARLCTGLAGYLSLVAVFLLASRLWGQGAGVKSLLLMSASSLFVLLGHQLTLDMLLSFCLLICLACFLMAQTAGDARQCAAWMLGCWAAMAFAMLTKGLIGVLIPAATLTLYAISQRDWPMLRRLNLRWGVPLFTLIAAPWFVLAARANPAFLGFFFVREHFQRFLTPIEHRTEPWWFFIPVLAMAIMPWLPQALRALALIGNERPARGQFDALRLLWIWSVFVLLFFSFSHSKLIAYILPAIPALALLCASPGAAEGRGTLIAGAVLSLATGAGILAYASGRFDSADALTLVALIRPVLWWTCALLGVGALLCLMGVLRAQLRAALAALSVAWFLASVTILIAANRAQALFSAKDIASTLRALSAADGPIFSVQSYQQSLPFYLRRAVVLVNYRDEFDLGLTQEPDRGIATLPEFSARWRSLSQGYAVMPQLTRDRLSALQVPMRDVARFPGRVIISRR
jgi:4-amino-4-deoxy-L-arabinose transferase-like glycosyltransferase